MAGFKRNEQIMHHTYIPQGVCSRQIDFDIEADGTVANVRFTGGCHGNTQGIGLLAQGMQAEELIARLHGVDCRGRGTSCPDQFARALTEALAEENM